MQCHDVQQLVAFANRKSVDLDAAERSAILDHVEKCPDCGAMFHAEARTDEKLGTLMRDVPVPATLKQQVMARLAAESRMARWKSVKRGSVFAAAAALLLVVAGGVGWFAHLPVAVSDEDLLAHYDGAKFHGGWNQARAKDYLSAFGFEHELPTYFDYTWLQNVEIVEFKDRRVAKLTFVRGADVASILVLPSEQFRTTNLVPNPTWLNLVPGNGVTYLILFRGNPEAMRPVEIAA